MDTTAQFDRGGRGRRGRKAPGWLVNLRHDRGIHVIFLLGLAIAFLPLWFMLTISVKSMGQFMVEPLGLTYPIATENYVIAWNVLKRSLLNSLGMTLVVVVVSIGIAALSAYVFALFQFPGRNLLFWSFLSVLFIPGILTFATRYQLVDALGMVDTYAVQILPYIALSQIFQIVVLRSFFASLPLEVIESAQVDGAGIWRVFLQIVLPMSRPILATLAVIRAIGFWDEWLWPMVTVFKWELRPMALQVFYLSSDIGPHVGRQMAGYVLASIPLLIFFAVANKQFVKGLTSGAIKM